MSTRNLYDLLDDVTEARRTGGATDAQLSDWAHRIREEAKAQRIRDEIMTDLVAESIASAPPMPAGGFGAARGVLRQPCEVVSFHAAVAARHPR